MSIKEKFLKIIEDVYVETDFGKLKDIGLNSDFFDGKSDNDVLDGLVKKHDGDKTKALDSLNKYISTVDGMLNKKAWEAKNNLEKAINNKELTEDEKKKEFGKNEVYSYIMNGIHPNIAYEKPMLRYIDQAGGKHVIVLAGIEKTTDPNPDVFVKEMHIERTNGDKWVKRFLPASPMNVSEFLDIVNNDLNKDVLAHVLKGQSNNPEDWMEQFKVADQNKTAEFDKWKTQNTMELDLDKRATKTIYSMYKDHLKGYGNRELDIKYKNAFKDNLKEDAYIKDPKEVKRILMELGLNPDYRDVPLKKEYPDMGDDTEPTFNFTIVGVPHGEISEIKALYVKDWDKRSRPFLMDLSEIREIASRPENQDVSPDIWDIASTPQKQSRSLNTGTAGYWQPLTKDQIITVLTRMEANEQFEGINLVDKFLNTKSFENRSQVVIDALKAFDPETSIKATKNSTGINGVGYMLFIAHDDAKSSIAPATGGKNPYKTTIKQYG